ncbi:methylmalonyl-CoA mutase [Nocardioides anomalus]|uniref:Methylmalonyl-CoA mutase n=1 Tax=Nocardioides anomalus TaxID=2712223 RepID=A0A6G6WLE6_9ACTN|nr:methylmalonyl-CoA mutase [Nocardioides anomalus]
MEPDQGTLDLAAPQDRHDRTEWEAAAAAVLRKARRLRDEDPDGDVWARLTRTTLDGIEVSPLGTPELLEGLTTSGRPTRTGGWDVRAQLTLTGDAEADNRAVLAELEGGATSVELRGTAGRAGDWAGVLDGVLLDLAGVVLDGDQAGAAAFLDHAEDRTLHPSTNLGLDPASPDPALAARAAAAGVRAYVVDATAVHDRGASDVQELAYALKLGADHLRAAGDDLDAAARLLEFRYAATDEQFPTIAKLRAARRLWARVLELSGAESRTQHQHAVTSRPMLSKYDPYVNMLRTTVAAFAAGVGGADAVTVLPFDTPLGVPEGFGRRIARNTSHLLIDEAHVGVVTDPAGGAYAVERLTDDLAVAAWELFGRLDGGEDLEPLIAATAAERDRLVATRKRPITGLTEFPALGEELPAREPAPDDVRRYGAAFEALRDDPAPQAVLLAPLGTVAQHTARATFATNLLAAGGVAVTTEGTSPVACVVGTDAAYDEEGAALAERLREDGVRWVVVAGQPRAWADDSAAMGVDALDFLTRTREKLA